MVGLRARVHEILEAGKPGDRLSQFADMGLIALISLNAFAVILESVPEYHRAYRDAFFAFEVFSVAVFTVEYVCRVWSSPEHPAVKYAHPVWGRLRYMLTPMALLDLIVIAPFYLVFFVSVDLRILRVLRLLRVFRLTRYAPSMTLLLQVLRTEARNIGAALFVLLLLMVMAASVVFLAEHRAQPEAFGSIPAALWWAVVTMTTIGYGDVVPVTFLGRLFGAVIGIVSLGMVALPAGLLASGFSGALRRRRLSYERLVDQALEDGHIDHHEHDRLREIQESLGLSDDDAAAILREGRERSGQKPDTCPHCGEPLETPGPRLKKSA